MSRLGDSWYQYQEANLALKAMLLHQFGGGNRAGHHGSIVQLESLSSMCEKILERASLKVTESILGPVSTSLSPLTGHTLRIPEPTSERSNEVNKINVRRIAYIGNNGIVCGVFNRNDNVVPSAVQGIGLIRGGARKQL